MRIDLGYIVLVVAGGMAGFWAARYSMKRVRAPKPTGPRKPDAQKCAIVSQADVRDVEIWIVEKG